jgi:hypothetical protein
LHHHRFKLFEYKLREAIVEDTNLQYHCFALRRLNCDQHASL